MVQRNLVVCAISDTHLKHDIEIPECDVLIHAGDACIEGDLAEFRTAMDWLAEQDANHKIYVPGNHDAFAFKKQKNAYWMCFDRGIIMLVNARMVIGGRTFWGAPQTREFGYTKAFMYPASKDYEAWQPLRDYIDSDNENIDVLITHSPPAGILDHCFGNPLGSQSLYDIVTRCKPKYHIFGHVHTEHGASRVLDETIYANVARTDGNGYCATDPVYTFELDPINEVD